MFISEAFLKTCKPPPLMFSCENWKIFEPAVEHPETTASILPLLLGSVNVISYNTYYI